MGLILDQEQQMLARTAREFVRSHAPVSALRALRDAGTGEGFDRSTYTSMAELGWAGLIIPEAHGGLGLGYAELGIVLEELGRELVASPLFSTLALGASTLLLSGDSSQLGCLEAVAEGEHLLTLAYQEGGRHRPGRCATRAEAVDGGYRLRGKKHYVLDAPSAHTLLVVARTAGADDDQSGLSVFRIERGAKGVGMESLGLVDSRAWANVTLEDVRVSKDAVVGEPGAAGIVLERVFDRAAAALSAEMLGGAQQAFEVTVEYLKTRKQFGVPIGSFQALKHRAANLYNELELLRSAALDALRAVDAERPDVTQAASIAKARACEVFNLAASEGVQMHGGIGMTDEHDIGFYFKRARTAELLLGDAAFHRRRHASACGY